MNEYQQFLSEQIDMLEHENAALCLAIEELQEQKDKPATVDYPTAAIIPHVIFTPDHYGFRTNRRMALSQKDMEDEFGTALYLITRMVGDGAWRGDSIKKLAERNNLRTLLEILRVSAMSNSVGLNDRHYDYDLLSEGWKI